MPPVTEYSPLVVGVRPSFTGFFKEIENGDMVTEAVIIFDWPGPTVKFTEKGAAVPPEEDTVRD
jgi:hypothetical protein